MNRLGCTCRPAGVRHGSAAARVHAGLPEDDGYSEARGAGKAQGENGVEAGTGVGVGHGEPDAPQRKVFSRRTTRAQRCWLGLSRIRAMWELRRVLTPEGTEFCFGVACFGVSVVYGLAGTREMFCSPKRHGEGFGC